VGHFQIANLDRKNNVIGMEVAKLSGEGVTYRSYLLRLWREDPRAAWRASLQSTASSEVRKFAGVEQLWAFLVAELELDRDGWAAGDRQPGPPEPGPPD
jgi:hypothetical protein